MEEQNNNVEEQESNTGEQDSIVEKQNNNLEQQECNIVKLDNNMKDQDINIVKEDSIVEEQNINIEQQESYKNDEYKNMEENKNTGEQVNNLEEEKSSVDKSLKKRKIIKWSIISLSSLLIIYLGMSIYFIDRFYFGSAINTINISGKTVDEVNKQMADEIETYTLVLEERGDRKEEIHSADIGLKYNSHDKIQEIKDNQNPFQWIFGLFGKADSKLTEIASYDNQMLKEYINKLSCFDSSNIVEPKNPSFKYTDKGYEVIKEVNGNKINKDILYENVVNAILKEETTLNLESINCYEKPQYTSESKEVIDAKNMLNKYTSASITYTLGDGKEVLNGSKINTWLNIDKDFQVTFNVDQIRKYVDTLAGAFNTVGKTRNFDSSSRGTVKVSGGNYGRQINKAKEVEALIDIIKQGKTVTKEPIYAQTALSNGTNDIGNTYVEIDLTNQYIWFYKNGSLIVKGSVVTGNVSAGNSTPQGTYKLTYKQKNAVLRGPGYAAPVTFWMPFNGGIGIHDASWRSTFGGNIYKTDGSHGCINSPYHVAEAIFNNIEAGTPVICYF